MADGIPYRIPFTVGTVYRTPASTGSGTLFAKNTTPRILVPLLLSGVGVVSAAARIFRINTTAALSGGGALSGLAEAEYTRQATLTGNGVLSATARMYSIHETATFTSRGALTATVHAEFVLSAAITSRGVVGGVVYQKFTETAAFTGRGGLSAAVQAEFGLSAALTSQGVLRATAVALIRVTAVLSGHGVVSTTGQTETTVAATLTGHGSLTGRITTGAGHVYIIGRMNHSYLVDPQNRCSIVPSEIRAYAAAE